ncbi:ATPase, T2SS/T4P/T4SS family [Cupriavidus sp. BIC8F]|uniref:ATPase, T2SS/T4P/T4SS family n=1 Tax=Cupriavidus sp. BIC8F TaxID=3079014 RepID=UPI002915D8AE|nr:ATPase, T2SS/T4P/T4SS family [Cupriavidus sp. BIC8F]
MLNIRLQQRNGSAEVIHVKGPGCTIGKDPGCDIVLKGLLIGKVHARIEGHNGGWYIEDQGGIASTLINGNPITRYGPLAAADQIEIGGFVLSVVAEPGRAGTGAAAQPSPPQQNHTQPQQDAPAPQAAVSVPMPVPPPSPPREAVTLAPSPQASVPVLRDAVPAPRPPAPAPIPAPVAARPALVPPADEALRAPINSLRGVELRKQAHQRLIAALDLRRVNVARMDEDELRELVGSLLDDILKESVFRSQEIPLDALKQSVFDEVIGLGPLEELLDDDAVSEIMVNCHDEIFVERAGRLTRSPVIFTDDRAVLGAIERIVAPLGRRIDESSPMVDARLPDGSRVNAVIPPLALKGPNITIRKFSRKKLRGEDLVAFGSLSPEMLEFLRTAVERRANIVISGGTGSGKTTLLNVLSSFIPDDERIVTVEDAAELQLSQPNLVSLEARPPNMEGKGAVTIRDLVKNCLRMRPDRIVVGECRGGEALDMLQAMNTGHDGSLTTAHANSPRDCLSRLEVMTLMAGLDLPVQAIREQVCSAVDVIVQQTRFSCGSRRVTHITEVSGMETGVVQLQDVFMFREEGYGADGKVKGRYVATSYIPDFYQDLIRRGIQVNTGIFTARDE